MKSSKFNKAQIFKDAWKYKKVSELTLSDGLKLAWKNAKKIKEKKVEEKKTGQTKNYQHTTKTPSQKTIVKERNNTKNTESSIACYEFVSEEGELFVEYVGINVGQRKEITEDENNTFEYLGKVNYRTKFSEIYEEPLLYSHEIWVAPETDVLNYLLNVKSTQGISENVLLEKLKELTMINNEIEILSNISLPIKNRTYGYKPDICVVYKKYNLYIDIEIDEPYDIISRKPIHYIGCESDILRNFYFSENGWIVFRFSEYQIIKYPNLCRNFIAKQIDYITETDILKSFYKNAEDLPVFPRWTYEEALKLAEENQRERDLEINSIKYPLNYNKKIVKGVKTDIDILPTFLSDKFSELKKVVEQALFVKLILTNGEQKLLQNSNLKKKLYLSGLNTITQKEVNIDIRKIEQKKKLQSPFKTNEIVGYDNICKALTDTIKKWGYAKIDYTNSAGENSNRNISMIFPEWIDDLSYNIIFKHTLNHLPVNEYVSAKCFMRNEKRTFRIDRINKMQIFDIDDSYLIEQYKNAYNSSAYNLLIEHDLKNAKDIFEHLVKLYPDDLMILGNLAHSLFLSGLEEDAYKIYNENKGKMIAENMSWEQMIKDDFEQFEENGYDVLLLNNCIEKLDI
jgi:hypothetical protein